MKCRVLLRLLELPYDTVTVDLFRRETRTPEHLARNPDGRVPVLELDGGETIPESGAILLYLAEGTPLLPGDRLARARVHQWLFFEQNQIEAQLAVTRFLVLTGRAARAPRARRRRCVARGRGVDGVARARAGRRPRRSWRATSFTVADIALHAYVHCAGDAGVDPREFDGVGAVARPRRGGAGLRQRPRAVPAARDGGVVVTRLAVITGASSGIGEAAARAARRPSPTCGSCSSRAARSGCARSPRRSRRRRWVAVRPDGRRRAGAGARARARAGRAARAARQQRRRRLARRRSPRAAGRTCSGRWR